MARTHLDAASWQQVLGRFAFLQGLSTTEQERLRYWVVLFLHEKDIEGAGGIELDASMRLTIAMQACLLILNLDVDYYSGWAEIIVYPDEFVPEIEVTDEDGVVHVTHEPRTGEAWLHGPVILSWADIVPAPESDGVNVVIHEFAHKLDMLNGDANGCPPLHPDMNYVTWARVFAAAYEDFCRRVETDEAVLIDPYAAEDPAEFFAVMSEVFFDSPQAVVDSYPDVYVQLQQFYRQHPLARLPR